MVTLLAGDANTNNIIDANSPDGWEWENHFEYAGDFTEGDYDGSGYVLLPDLDLLDANRDINLQNAWLLADLDGDLDVDDDDLVIFDDNLGMSNPTRADGDLDGDSDIDAADLDLMFAQYGIDLAAAS